MNPLEQDLFCGMAFHNDTGNIGEEYAIQYLIGIGFTILHRNWRFGHYEIDIIANVSDKLHFIEVKARTNLRFGYPEEAVGKTKLRHLIKSANHFLLLYPHWERIQFDILSILLFHNKEVSYFFIEDVYL